MDNMEYKIVVVGGGTAGITVTAQLLRKVPALEDKIAIIDPSTKHFYQPLWTLVGGGASKKENSVRDMASVIPNGATWIQEAVESFHPEENKVKLKNGNSIRYEYLVVC